MTLIAPNLSNVVGSSTAAKLLTAAGGLSAFCKIPACNIEVKNGCHSIVDCQLTSLIDLGKYQKDEYRILESKYGAQYGLYHIISSCLVGAS